MRHQREATGRALMWRGTKAAYNAWRRDHRRRQKAQRRCRDCGRFARVTYCDWCTRKSRARKAARSLDVPLVDGRALWQLAQVPAVRYNGHPAAVLTWMQSQRKYS